MQILNHHFPARPHILSMMSAAVLSSGFSSFALATVSPPALRASIAGVVPPARSLPLQVKHCLPAATPPHDESSRLQPSSPNRSPSHPADSQSSGRDSSLASQQRSAHCPHAPRTDNARQGPHPLRFNATPRASNNCSKAISRLSRSISASERVPFVIPAIPVGTRLISALFFSHPQGRHSKGVHTAWADNTQCPPLDLAESRM
jgi:hypothetical protein